MDLVLILLLHVSAVDCIEGAYITLASLSHKSKMYACMYARQDKTICICIRVNICIHIRSVQCSPTKQIEGIEQAYGK